jgi:hypothetical protein
VAEVQAHRVALATMPNLAAVLAVQVIRITPQVQVEVPYLVVVAVVEAKAKLRLVAILVTAAHGVHIRLAVAGPREQPVTRQAQERQAHLEIMDVGTVAVQAVVLLTMARLAWVAQVVSLEVEAQVVVEPKAAPEAQAVLGLTEP